MSTTMPALFTVLVGDDPVRHLAARRKDGWWSVWKWGQWSSYLPGQVHDVVEVIPDGTPVDRIVVLPEAGEARLTHTGNLILDGVYLGDIEDGGLAGSLAYHEDAALKTAARYRKAAAFVAARAAEPTPDPLAQARERLATVIDNPSCSLYTVLNAARGLLAATEGGAS